MPPGDGRSHSRSRARPISPGGPPCSSSEEPGRKRHRPALWTSGDFEPKLTGTVLHAAFEFPRGPAAHGVGHVVRFFAQPPVIVSSLQTRFKYVRLWQRKRQLSGQSGPRRCILCWTDCTSNASVRTATEAWTVHRHHPGNGRTEQVH